MVDSCRIGIRRSRLDSSAKQQDGQESHSISCPSRGSADDMYKGGCLGSFRVDDYWIVVGEKDNDGLIPSHYNLNGQIRWVDTADQFALGIPNFKHFLTSAHDLEGCVSGIMTTLLRLVRLSGIQNTKTQKGTFTCINANFGCVMMGLLVVFTE